MKSLPIPMSWPFPFSSASFIILGLYFKSLIHLNWFFCVCCRIRVQFHSSVYSYSGFFKKHHLSKRLFFHHYILGNLVEIQMTVHTWIYFGAFYSVLLFYMSVLMPELCYFDYCSFGIYFEIRSVEPPALNL